MYFYGDSPVFYLVYIVFFLSASFRALQSAARKRTRTFLIIVYAIILALQLVFYAGAVGDHESWLELPLRKFFAVLSLLLPVIISRFVTVSKHTEFYLPSFHEAMTISFSQINEFTDSVTHAVTSLKKAGGRLSPENFKCIIKDLPRHGQFNYVTTESIPDEYFTAAESTLNDCGIYIILSNTGAPASEIISVFTQKQLNHASISFDADLKTIVSYNGGERAYLPGLNFEMVDYFNKKADASILVYRLPVTIEQKRAAIDKVAQINAEGSAYNLLGLISNRSLKPNIMYCSQFIYTLLDTIGASYFESTGVIKPTDFIEKDYYRKLEFVKELKLNSN